MATGFPDYQFLLGYKKPILFIGGFQLLFNRIKTNNDGEKTAYFYCVNKVKHGIFCSSSAKALVVQDDDDKKYVLANYNGGHSSSCVPNFALCQVMLMLQ